jgi:hypothetical protein
MPDKVDVMFARNPVFTLEPDAEMRGTRAVAWYGSAAPLHSGWAWGQTYLRGGLAAAESSLGKGKVFLICPEITFRGQSHATFPLLFNGIYYAAAQSVSMAAGAAGR